MYHLAFLKICALDATNIQNTQNRECWDCCMIILKLIWQLHVYFLYTLFLKTFLAQQFNRCNTVYFKTMAHFVCCVWDSLERVWGEWVCSKWLCGVCVCVSALCGCEWRELNVSCSKNLHLFHEGISGYL